MFRRLLGWNEGSLLRRTLVSVGTFVVGSAAFLALVSFVLVSIARGVLPSRSPDSKDSPSPEASASAGGKASSLLTPKPNARAKRKPVSAESADPESEE